MRVIHSQFFSWNARCLRFCSATVRRSASLYPPSLSCVTHVIVPYRRAFCSLIAYPTCFCAPCFLLSLASSCHTVSPSALPLLTYPTLLAHRHRVCSTIVYLSCYRLPMPKTLTNMYKFPCSPLGVCISYHICFSTLISSVSTCLLQLKQEYDARFHVLV